MTRLTPKRDSRILWMALALSILWVAALYYIGPRVGTPGGFGDQNVRYPASYDWALHDLKGESVSFDRFKGKTVFLNIWATWCPPCIAEMPSIAALAENPRLQKRGIEFVCVATDESADDVRRFLNGKSWKMTFLRAESLPQAYFSEGIPATYAISREGVVVGAVTGGRDWNTSEVVDFLEKLATAEPDSRTNSKSKSEPESRSESKPNPAAP